MIQEGEDDLICDLAETYGIYNYKSLPVQLVATFSYGLSENSRIKRKLRGEKETTEQYQQRILIAIFDRINWLAWSRSEDAANNVNMPESLYDKIYNPHKDDDKKVVSFRSGEDFMKEWNRRISNANNS